MANSRPEASVGFKTVQLFKDQTLGIGSYGKVCKAKCDDLLCAAKLIHETLIDPNAQQLIAPQREHRLPMRRFEQECDFLSTIRHPNIVQYLAIYQDPDTGLPVLLMELMDDSITHFLESSTQPIPYHIQVDICHDITLALSFLHSNSIVHRDLSSNNVLLIGNAIRAKVTDFGMARLGDQNSRASHLTFTMCPGTDVFMPPEAVRDKPVYTEKIDCFSFGVVTLQILTQQFPKPGDRQKEVEINQPGLPRGTYEMVISETERRQNHISNVDPNHTLLKVSLDCLKDRDVERPSAQQLCERLAALKGSAEYIESLVRDAQLQERNIQLQEHGADDGRDREIRSLRQQHIQQVQNLEQVIQLQLSRLEETDRALGEKDGTIAAGEQQIREKMEEIGRLVREKDEVMDDKERELGQKQDENQQLEREKNQIIEEKERELGQTRDEYQQLEREKNEIIEEKEREQDRVKQQLEEYEHVIAQFQERIAELEQLIPPTESDAALSGKQQSNSSSTKSKMTWKKGKEAPCVMSSSCNAVADGTALYVRTACK